MKSSFYALQPGERFKALIVDIKPGSVTIRLDDGGTFTARTRVLPEARIGEESLFSVRENNFKGQILLEMVKLNPETKQDNILREALFNAGMFVNDDNLALGRAMIAHHLPVDAGMLQKAAFFRYLHTEMPLDRVVFLLRENFPADTKSITTVNQAVDQPEMLAKAMAALPEAFDNTEQAVLFFNNMFPDESGMMNADATSLRNIVRRRLFLLLSAGQNTSNTRVLHQYYNDLLRLVNRGLTIAQDGFYTQPTEHLLTIRESLRFMEQITRHRTYYQIPFIVAPHTQTRLAELHIFGRDLTRQAEYVITMDTAALGRVEVFAQKTDRQVKLQFRCEQEHSARLVNAQSARLTEALAQKGISVTGVSGQKLVEAFTLLSPEPGSAGSEAKGDSPPKRFAFDMRV